MASCIPPGQAKYPPELVAFIGYTNVNAGAEAKVEEVKDFGRKPNQRHAHVLGIAGVNVASVNLRLTTKNKDEFVVASFGTIDRLEDFDRFADKLVKLAVYNGSGNNLTGDPANPSYASRLYMAYIQPTIIEKLRRGVALTSDETTLALKYGLEAIVDYGIAPEFNPENVFNIDSFSVIDKVAVADQINVSAGGSEAQAQTLGRLLDVGEDEAIILYEISTDGSIGVPSDGVKVKIARDGQTVMIIDNYAMPAIERHIPLWIPALDYLHVTAWATNLTNNFNFVYKYAKVKLNLLNKVRWLDRNSVEFVDTAHENLYDRAKERYRVGLPINGFENGI